MGEGPFDLAVGNVERAELVPALGIIAEETHGGGLAALLQGVEPGTVGGNPGMLGIEAADEFVDEGGIFTARRQPEARELRLPETLQQAGFDQELQVARDAWLALPQHVDIVADRQILAGRQCQDAQPRVLGGCSQQGKQMIHRLKNISISLCVQHQKASIARGRKNCGARSHDTTVSLRAPSKRTVRVQHSAPVRRSAPPFVPGANALGLTE